MCPKPCHVTLSAPLEPAAAGASTREPPSLCDGSGGYARVFSDEFDGPLDEVSSWHVVEGIEGSGSMTRSAWGARDNVYVEDGALVLRSRRPTARERADHPEVGYFTGAVSTWRKRDFAPGRLCVSARLPGRSAGDARGKNQGLFPAHWLMPTHANDFDKSLGCWYRATDRRGSPRTHALTRSRTAPRTARTARSAPRTAAHHVPTARLGLTSTPPLLLRPDLGEIDIVEQVNGEPAYYGTYHWNGNYRGARGVAEHRCSVVEHDGWGHGEVQRCAPLRRWDEEYHEYAVEWDGASHVSFYVNAVHVGTTDATTTPTRDPGAPPAFYDDPMFLMLQTALGGAWSGEPDEQTELPAYHRVDYVRYEARLPGAAPNSEPPCAVWCNEWTAAAEQCQSCAGGKR